MINLLLNIQLLIINSILLNIDNYKFFITKIFTPFKKLY